MQIHQTPIVLRTIRGETVLQGPLSFFGQGKDGQLYFIQIAQRFHADPIPIGHQMASDRLAPRISAPILKEIKSEYYIASKMPLDAYHAKISNLRREQIQDMEDRERWKKILEFADASLSVASLVIPFARIGELFITTMLLTTASIATHAAQGTFGDKAACQAILKDDILDLLFDNLKTMFPCWARFAVEAKPFVSVVYTAADRKKEIPPGKWVPADGILDQIYRFRCIINPGLPKQIQACLDNNQLLYASILGRR